MALGYANNNPYGVVDLIGRNYFQGSPKFGLYSGNPVKPNMNGMVFKTDENGNPTPLTADEMELLKQKSASTSREAAIEAASPSPVSQKNSPWYDFLKHPQNTPYEQEQMRNQGILRDAAIAAAMNKPVFFPEADTLSEPMAELAGQQNGLAQSAMQQFTTRQGMSQNLFNQGANLVTTLAGKSLESDLSAQTYFANAERDLENSRIVKEQAEKLFKDNNVPEEIENIIKSSYGTPKFLEVVKSKELEKYQSLVKDYDALMRTVGYLQNSSDSWKQRGNAQLSKSSAYMNGASDVDANLELGIGIKPQKVDYQELKSFERPKMSSQGDIGRNVAGAYGNFSNPKNESPATSTPNTTAPTAPAATSSTSGASGKGNLVFKNGKVVKASVPKSDSSFEEGSAERDFENLANEYYKIGRFGVGGAWQNLDTQVQRRALDDNWLRRINGVKQKLALDLRNNPESFAKHRPLFDFIRSGNQFGDTSKLLESAANPPQSYDLSYYANQFNATGDEVERGDLQDYLAILNEGGALTMPEVKHLEKMLTERFPVTNLKGEKKPLLQQNGLKIKFFKATNPDGSPMLDDKEQLYFVPLKDSFK